MPNYIYQVICGSNFLLCISAFLHPQFSVSCRYALLANYVFHLLHIFVQFVVIDEMSSGSRSI